MADEYILPYINGKMNDPNWDSLVFTSEYNKVGDTHRSIGIGRRALNEFGLQEPYALFR